jgi:hypothetical protein
MPLPSIAGDPGTLLGGENPASGGPTPSMGSNAASDTQPDQQVQNQMRGAMQSLGALKQQTQSTLKAIATQFPGASKDAGQLQDAFDSALSNLMRSLVRITQTPEPQGPKVLR